eukprot:GHVS01081665.1.p1 GENE.GHVS01081665.1~~GHVS01081665.1.p1  ORF type:complete len:538 (-),score=116.90 GHVS01081665.1:296-1909(-)
MEAAAGGNRTEGGTEEHDRPHSTTNTYTATADTFRLTTTTTTPATHSTSSSCPGSTTTTAASSGGSTGATSSGDGSTTSGGGDVSATTADLAIPLPGDLLEEPAKSNVLKKVRELCGWRMTSFPGSQPVSLSKANLMELSRQPYVACEKSDGIRYLLFAASKSVFLVDRKQDVRVLKMHLPRRGLLHEAHQVTLLDGELVMDAVEIMEEVAVEGEEDGNKVEIRKKTKIVKRVTNEVRYLIYDAISIQRDVSLRERNLLYRLNQIAVEVIQPYNQYYKDNTASGGGSSSSGCSVVGSTISPRSPPPLLPIYLKDFFDIWDVEDIYQFSGRLPHLSDGIIFTPVRLPYTPGTCHQLLKWKPPHLNTVDFSADMLLDQAGKPRLIQLYVSENGARVFKGDFAAPFGDEYRRLVEATIRNEIRVHQLIVECYWVAREPVYTFRPAIAENMKTSNINDFAVPLDFDTGVWVMGGWVIERVRTDKQMPNDFRVVMKVMESIEDGITFKDLKTKFKSYKLQGKKSNAEMCRMPDYYTECHREE